MLEAFYKDQEIASLFVDRVTALNFAARIKEHALSNKERSISLAPAALPRITKSGAVHLGLAFVLIWNRTKEGLEKNFVVHFFGPRGGILRAVEIRDSESILQWSREIEDVAN